MPDSFVDGLIALVIFVVIPLIQWLRTRSAERSGTQAHPEAPGPSLPTPPVPRRQPLPSAPRPQPDRLPAPYRAEQRPVERPPKPVPKAPASPPGQPADQLIAVHVAAPRPPSGSPPASHAVRRGAIPAALHDRSTLRRAIVLMTVLGPCRAAAPYGAGDAASGAGR